MTQLRLDAGLVPANIVRPGRAQADSASTIDLFTDEQWVRLVEAFALTPRQSTIARLLCAGHTYKSISVHVGISINTVRMHMRALFQKLGAHDRVGFLIQMIHLERVLSERSAT